MYECKSTHSDVLFYMISKRPALPLRPLVPRATSPKFQSEYYVGMPLILVVIFGPCILVEERQEYNEEFELLGPGNAAVSETGETPNDRGVAFRGLG